MSIAFLEEALLADMTLTTSEFQIYKPETAHNYTSLEYLVLDSQALQHLEVVENA